MALAYQEHYTYEDFRRWEGEWELIDGVPYAMSPFAFPKHQRISGKIFRQFDEQLDNCAWCKAFMEAEVKLSDDTIVRPDVLVYCYPYDQILDKVPSLIVEVVSSGSKRRDEVLKMELYERYRVPYYILVYPEDRLAIIYQWDGRYKKVTSTQDERFEFEVECKVALDFSRVWE